MDNNVLSNDIINEKQRKGITGSTLKLIAIITMLIDHTAATIVDRMIVASGINNLDPNNVQAMMDYLSKNGSLIALNMAMRLIGRIAFPIFCFLLVEGFKYTSNRYKYALRIAVFALISELPFDFAFYGKLFYNGHQNVYFTLLIGLLVMIGISIINEKLSEKKWLPILSIAGAISVALVITYTISGILSFANMMINGVENANNTTLLSIIITVAVLTVIMLVIYWVNCKKNSIHNTSIFFAKLLVLSIGMAVAQLLKTDYAAFGVLTVAVIYGLRNNSVKAMVGGCITLTIMSFMEAVAFIDVLFVKMYNGKRGLNLKYVFYLFYPVHLLVLYMICRLMNLV